MAWTELTRRQHARQGGKYASDTSDAEWALIAPLTPPPKTTGRPRTTCLRDVVDALLYIATTGCQWRMLPNDFPPVSTVRGYFYAWRDNGILDDMNRKLVEAARLAENRKAAPTAGVIDSQSVKTTESGGVRGYDAGKRIKGRKRHIVTDTVGLLIGLVVHSAGIQDRDGAPDVLKAIASRYPSLRHVFADGGYAGPKLRDALKALGRWTVQIVKRSDTTAGFEVLPRRWVVERTFAWLNRCRRLSKDWEKSIASAEAWILIAHIRRVTRHLARNGERSISFESDSKVKRFFVDFDYQAASWDKERRVIAKIEWHPGELFPLVGFIVTNLPMEPDWVVRFYNQRGTAEQHIKEGKYAFHWTRLSCRRFRDNEVRLQLYALAYNLATFLRCIELPEALADWSLTSLQLKLIKIGARVIRHARAITFQLAEVAVTGPMVRAILAAIRRLRAPPLCA